MKRRSRLSMLLLLWLAPLVMRAEEHPAIVIENSRSPDGGKELVIVEGDDEDSGMANGTAKIREVETGKILGTFAWEGYGDHPTEHSLTVLWRPDSHAFAINWSVGKGASTYAIYLQSKTGWTEVQTPDFDKAKRKLGRLVTEHETGKGFDSANAWLPGNRLRVESAMHGTYAVDAKGSEHEYFWFTLKIPAFAAQPKPRAILQKSEFAPLSEENR